MLLRKPSGLPYVQPNPVGRLSYVRRIPAELRPYAGNQTVIRRSLGLRTTNQSDPAVIQAWNRAHEEAEALLHQAETAKAAADVQKLSPKQEPTPLKPLYRAGNAAEPWRQLLQALDQGPSAAEHLGRMFQFNALLKSSLPALSVSRDAAEVERLSAEVNRELLAVVSHHVVQQSSSLSRC